MIDIVELPSTVNTRIPTGIVQTSKFEKGKVQTVCLLVGHWHKVRGKEKCFTDGAMAEPEH